MYKSLQRRQRGSALLFALVALLLVFLGAIFTLRGVLTDSGLTDRFSERQKDVQASDLGLQWIANQIAVLGTTQALEISATGQPWYLSSPPASPVATDWPPPAYWQTCANPGTRTSTDTCVSVPMPSSVPQSALVFVVPTGRVDPYACNTQGLTAIYYDIWIQTTDARGGVSADTEALYKLCVLSG
ncbi:MAG: hypothetical protein ACYDBH_14130 [Acidobacteriaceae bacterium]